MPAVHNLGNYIQLAVNGSTSHPDINTFVMEVLSNENPSSVTINCIEGTVSERYHPTNEEDEEENEILRQEINFTALASSMVTVDNQGLPYGSNPRLPVLCPTFSDIFDTVTDEENFYDFIAFNTGIDIFANSINVEGSDVNIVFDGPIDGIANGGLTFAVLLYASQLEILPENLRVSVRVWSKANQTTEELTNMATKRNSHRPLEDFDKLNQLGAFNHLKAELDEAYAERIVWHTGDQDVDQSGHISVQTLCRSIHSFKMKSSGDGNERHPTLNPLPNGAIEEVSESIKLQGVITSPNKSWQQMWESIGGEQ